MSFDMTTHNVHSPQGVGARYHRISSNKQDYVQQVVAIGGWLAKNNLTTAHVLEDTRPRDLSDEGPAFQAMMAMVRGRVVTWVVIGSIDRLGFQDVHECFSFVHEFRRNKVALWSASDDLEITASHDLTIMRLVMAAMTSEREQVEKSKRSTGKRISQARLGRYEGGFVPYGTDL